MTLRSSASHDDAGREAESGFGDRRAALRNRGRVPIKNGGDTNEEIIMMSVRLRVAMLSVTAALLTGALGGCGSDSAPTIPHDITSEDAAYCLGCHRDGVNGAPKTPHPDRTGCTDCHKQAN